MAFLAYFGAPHAHTDPLIFISMHVMFIRRAFRANKGSAAPAMMLSAEDRVESFLTDQALIRVLIGHPLSGSAIVGKISCSSDGSTSSIFR